MEPMEREIVTQHLIDPEICIRCNTCEATCPVDAITHDSQNYVVDVDKCNHCMDCVAPCPTGSIDNWRLVPRSMAYSLADQFGWEELPEEPPAERLAAEGVAAGSAPVIEPVAPPLPAAGNGTSAQRGMRFGSTTPPWSAAHPCTNLYGAKAPEPWIVATVRGNMRVTDAGQEYDTHHVVLDFGARPFPVLEGQSIGVIPPGAGDKGRPHHPRRYSIASPRNGERPGYNNVSLTIKRVLEDHHGNPVRGVASNYLCDVQVGDEVKVVGPFGTSFLMPNHPRSNIVMICTGTGSAPMRAMTEWRRRLRKTGRYEGGKLMLFFGARTRAALPYLGPLQNLPKDFIDINFAFSREKGRPKRYVQDVMRERAGDLAALIADPDTYIYVCGLRAMEGAVALALRDVVEEAGLAWSTLGPALKSGGRLHPETY